MYVYLSLITDEHYQKRQETTSYSEGEAPKNCRTASLADSTESELRCAEEPRWTKEVLIIRQPCGLYRLLPGTN